MSKKDEACCSASFCGTIELDRFSKNVARKLTGHAIEERIKRESKIFSDNLINKKTNWGK